MNVFLDQLIQKTKNKTVFDPDQLKGTDSAAQAAAEIAKKQSFCRRGIGHILEQVTDVSQIIPDERPIDHSQAYQSENPEKVLQIKDLVSQKSLRWFKCEYFYSFIDKPFFKENELVETLHDAGMPIDLNKREWSMIRQQFSEQQKKPQNRPRRLFSAQFIEDEKKKLVTYRKIFRKIMQQYQAQNVTLNVQDGDLSEFKLDMTELL